MNSDKVMVIITSLTALHETCHNEGHTGLDGIEGNLIQNSG